MAEDTTKATFAVELQDNVSAGAESAAGALEKLKEQLDADSKALNDMQRAMKQLKAATTADVAAPMASLTKQIEAQKNTIAQAQGAYLALGGKFGGVAKKAKGLRESLREVIEEVKKVPKVPQPQATGLQQLTQAAQALPGPIGGVIAKLNTLVTGLSKAQLTAIAVGAAFLGAAFGAAKLTKSLFGEALAAQDATRNELLHFEALTKMRNLLGIAPGKATDMQDAVDRVSASVSIGRDKVSGYAETLYRAGLRGKSLETALEGTSIKASALGDAAGAGFAGFAATVALSGGAVAKLAENVKNRYGGIVQRQMSSIAVQQVKQRENWNSLFRGVKVEGFLTQLKALRDILNVNTAAGQALKSLFTTFLQPLFGAAETGIVFMRRFFKQMLIGALEMKIAYQEVRNWFARTFGKTQVTQAQDLLDTIDLGRYTVYILAAAFSYLAGTAIVNAIAGFSSFAVSLLATVIPAIWAGVAATASFAVSILAVTWPFLLAAVAVAAFVAGIAALYDLWNEFDWTDIGRNLWKSLITGLKSGWEAVKSVFSDLANEASKAFKTALGIASPSKVFAELGLEIPKGLTQGIVLGTPAAQQAAADLVTAPKLGSSTQADASPEAGAGAGLRGAQAGRSVTIGELHIHAATAEPKTLAAAFRRELESVLEGVSLEAGVPQLGAPA